ncbi:NAD(P)-dependent oxidoreductase [Streptomyces sporangiiformans]|uniref:NAD(P)-dependent oxidoreductase n=1 Tax=Streptomyces sporangiiformans TaxID=2315329 RepID=A0A505DKJ1_9ACTN|nr:NAD(P)-binding domain-containing protein [Streptomyces sporangiiformans]TPQ20376.1 NAD(P)-dependent oxidoreductase [Streptomyces sporangiiformans]
MPAHNSEQTPAKTSITVLGLGLMGTALATAFLKAGHPTTVWNRTPSKTAPLTAQGATPAATPAEAITANPLVLVCLTTYDDVTELLHPHTTALAGRTLVNVTNGTPVQARKAAAWAEEHGIAYVDGGIMAVPQMIATPAAYVLYSGAQEAYETYRPALAALGGTRWTGTDPGLASLYDLSLLTGMYGMAMGVAQSFALIRSEGIGAREFAPLLTDWLNAMPNVLVPGTAEAVDSGHHLTDVSTLAVNQAAFPNLLTTFTDQGVRPELFAPMLQLLDRAIAEGHAQDGLSRLVELLRVPRPDGS